MSSFVSSFFGNVSQSKAESVSKSIRACDPPPYTSWTVEMSALAERVKRDVSYKPTSLDKHSISQGIKLVSIAADEYESGNESVALNIYLTGVDKIIMALPNKADLNTKKAIKEKFESVEERMGIVQTKGLPHKKKEPPSSKLDSFFSHQHIAYQDPMIRFKQFGQYITEWTVAFAIFIKQSPLPDFIGFLLSCFINFGFWIDAYYGLSKRAQRLSLQIIKFGLEMDQHYRLHEFISEGLCMIITAGVKAAVAFKETA
ncbi:hypothetical protein BY458DRAFT_520939 [Sporodiniella umbellata]|nr:hypothetical protein BY458DRAFT_520939 [Sporodiniella umbellata]